MIKDAEVRVLGAMLCWLPLGAIAALQLSSIWLSMYDPVADDNVDPKLMPAYYAYAASLILISAFGSILTLWPRALHRYTWRIVLCCAGAQGISLAATIAVRLLFGT